LDRATNFFAKRLNWFVSATSISVDEWRRICSFIENFLNSMVAFPKGRKWENLAWNVGTKAEDYSKKPEYAEEFHLLNRTAGLLYRNWKKHQRENDRDRWKRMENHMSQYGPNPKSLFQDAIKLASKNMDDLSKGEMCANCFTLEADIRRKLERCSGCRLIKYCSLECQQSHWKVHRLTCKNDPYKEEETRLGVGSA